MFKTITFARLTEKGQQLPPEKAPIVLAKVNEIVKAYGGKVEYMWATIGRFDFVSLTEYPDEPAAFKARTKIMELGLFHLETTAAFPVEAYIEALKEQKVLVAV
ncbi:MAG TPA: GYD domain-containing protein [Candidatus Dormibacteraeota bacterium]|nr:GYD domain-containing protein [Candidatus Dormibacteraeota bacterium]